MSELIDNRAHRVRTLKEIIKHLHAGDPPDTVKDRLAQLVRETDYSEIVAMEQELMAEGMPVEEVQCMCDLHSQVTREVLVQLPRQARCRRGTRWTPSGARTKRCGMRCAMMRLRRSPDRRRPACLAPGLQRADGHREALPAQGARLLPVPGAPRHHRSVQSHVGARTTKCARC